MHDDVLKFILTYFQLYSRISRADGVEKLLEQLAVSNPLDGLGKITIFDFIFQIARLSTPFIVLDVFAYTAIFSMYIHLEEFEKCFNLYRSMKNFQIVPDGCMS